MKASELKTALDPHIKRASQTNVKKIINKVKKKNQMKNMTAAKKDTEAKTQKNFGDLRDIVDIKKQKAIANEYDSLIYEQKIEKDKRSQKGSTPIYNSGVINPIQAVIANDPDKLKNMTLEEAKKLSMFTNKSGSSNSNISDIKEVIMAVNEMKKTDGGNGSLSDKIIGILLDKAFNNNGGNTQKTENSTDNTILKYMMEQNLKTQEMLINIMTKKNEAPVQQNNGLVKEFITLFQSQNDLKNSILVDKFNNMEARMQGGDSLGEMKKTVDFMKSVKGFFGSESTTPETMNHELKMKEMDFNQSQQVKEENMRDGRMMYIGDMIKEGIGVLGKTFSEPIAEAAKDKIEQFTESIKNPKEKVPREKVRNKISPEILKKEIDLGNLDDFENELNKIDNNYIEPIKRRRFKVSESGK